MSISSDIGEILWFLSEILIPVFYSFPYWVACFFSYCLIGMLSLYNVDDNQFFVSYICCKYLLLIWYLVFLSLYVHLSQWTKFWILISSYQYFLLQKRKLCSQANKLILVYLPLKAFIALHLAICLNLPGNWLLYCLFNMNNQLSQHQWSARIQFFIYMNLF